MFSFTVSGISISYKPSSDVHIVLQHYTNPSQTDETYIPNTEIYAMKNFLSVVKEKIKESLKSKQTNLQDVSLPLKCSDQQNSILLMSDFKQNAIWISYRTTYVFLDINNIVLLTSILESLCFAIPIVEILSGNYSSSATSIVSSNKPEIQETKTINETPNLQNIDLSRLEEVANMILTLDPKKITSDVIKELKQLISDYTGIQISASVDALQNLVLAIRESVNKHLKDETIFDTVKFLSDSNNLCKKLIEEYHSATSKSEKIRKVVTAFFVKEVIDTCSISESMSF